MKKPKAITALRSTPCNARVSQSLDIPDSDVGKALRTLLESSGLEVSELEFNTLGDQTINLRFTHLATGGAIAALKANGMTVKFL
jgi:hypothetical protein